MGAATLKKPSSPRGTRKVPVPVFQDPDGTKEHDGEPIRYLPKEVAILHGLIREAWMLAHRITATGVKFAGTLEQATLTIAGCAYAGWRDSCERQSDPAEQWAHTDMVSGFAEGVLFALTHAEGMPRRYAESYPAGCTESTNVFDRTVPLAEMSKYWPNDYTATGLKLKPPKLVLLRHGDLGLEAQLQSPQPNILTTRPEDVERARLADELRFRRLIDKTGRG